MDENFLISEQRHKELLSSIRKLIEVIDSRGFNVAPLENIKTEISSLKPLLSVDYQKMPNASSEIKEMKTDLIQAIKKLETLLTFQPKEPTKQEWKFDVERNSFGQIVNVIAKNIV